MKKLFYLLLCMPFVFAACEPEPAPEPAVDPVLTLTSAATINIDAAGGTGEINYTLENAVEGTELTANCEAAWITNFTIGDSITFTVLANEGAAREAIINVAYSTKSFIVTVKQAAPEVEAVRFEAQMFVGEYYGDYYGPGSGNYYLFLTDNGFSEDGNFLVNSTYYQLDIYAELFEGESDGTVTLPEGTYTFDINDTMAPGTIGYLYSNYYTTNDTEVTTDEKFEAAELVVTAEGATLTATIAGVPHIVTFVGEPVIADQRPGSGGGGDVSDVEINYAYAYYFGDMYTPGVADNFYFFLSDIGVDADGYDQANGRYFRFDLYADIIDAENGLAIPYGTYEIDPSSSMAPGTIDYYYSAYYVIDEYGYDYAQQSAIDSGSVTIDENGVTATIVIEGQEITISYEGAVVVYDSRSGEDDGGEGDGYYSTLYEDLVCTLDDHTLYYEYYSDWYEVGYMNWTFAIMPNSGEGDFVQFDVLAGPDSTDNFFGEYRVSSSLEAFTAMPGYIDYYLLGSWYYTEDGVTCAPFVDGTVSVADNGDGTVTVEFSVYDDLNYNISGSWTGQMLSAEELTRSAQQVKRTIPASVVVGGEKISLL